MRVGSLFLRREDVALVDLDELLAVNGDFGDAEVRVRLSMVVKVALRPGLVEELAALTVLPDQHLDLRMHVKFASIREADGGFLVGHGVGGLSGSIGSLDKEVE